MSAQAQPIRVQQVRKPVVLAAVRPNAGLEVLYQRKLEKLIEEMHKSVLYWIKAAYNVHAPEMATDASPAVALREIMRRLASRWQKRFDEAAPALAKYFALAALSRSDAALAAILKEAGFAVSFKMSRAMNDVVQASVGESVSLIKSIAEQHLTQVEGIVMRSVAQGRDAGTLYKELIARYGVTRKRAALIARHQNNMATAVINRVRQQEVGIKEAIWMHSHAGVTPRPTHVRAGLDKMRYEVAKGWYDPHAAGSEKSGWRGEFIWPGQLVNCRCTSRAILPWLTREQ